MKKKFKLLATLGCLLGLSVVLASCGELTVPESYEEKGYNISVTYDPSGGKIDNTSQTVIMDMYKSSNYEEDNNGTVHIKLTEPENTIRGETDKGEPQYKPMLEGKYFLVGWYQKRTVKKVNGHPVDDYGNVLFEDSDGSFIRVMYDSNGLPIESVRTRTDEDTGTLYDSEGYILVKTQEGKFYRVGKKDENGKVLEGYFTSEGLMMTVTPAYEYSDLWDFENDTLDYNREEDGNKKSLTLYAGWLKYFEFNYYYRFEDETNEDWKQYDGNYSFNYEYVNEKQTDKDTIYLPYWEDGKMKHEIPYQQTSGNFSFPKIEKSTFLAAYKDNQCQTQIVNSLEHEGTVDKETCTSDNRVQNVYIVLQRSERFKISTAQQFISYASTEGEYEIMNDLDFSYQVKETVNGVAQTVTKYYEWPFGLMSGKFEGKIYGKDGQTFTFSNIQATYKSGGSVGGLFGEIGSDAILKDIAFENVTFNVDMVNAMAAEAFFGLFAGTINDGATVDIEKVNGTLRIGNITFNNDYEVNLLANGDVSGIKSSSIALQIYGKYERKMDSLTGQYQDVYTYSVDPVDADSVKVENGNVTLKFKKSQDANYQAFYDIQINGGN